MSKTTNSKFNDLIVKFTPNKKTKGHYKKNTFNYGGKVKKVGEYNKLNLEAYDEVKPYLKGCKVALDIGARWGEWTRLLQKDFKHIYCFEPIRKRNQLINENCVTDNVTLYSCCLGEKIENVDMHGGCIFNRDLKGMEKKASRVNKISTQQSIRLDDLNINGVDFIKIDVEGYELPVIKGGINTIKKHRPVICLEQNGSERKWRGADKNEAMDFLVSIGMKVEKQLNHQDFLLVWKTPEELTLEQKEAEMKKKEEEMKKAQEELKKKEEALKQKEEALKKLEEELKEKGLQEKKKDEKPKEETSVKENPQKEEN
jgi:FkbM family methyltransferase